jgi:hypothetical protein
MHYSLHGLFVEKDVPSPCYTFTHLEFTSETFLHWQEHIVSGILVCSSLKLTFLVNLYYIITYVPRYL